MKWFKHENTYNNPKIMLITARHGIAAYGVYFAILELLSDHIEPNNKEEWGYLPETYSKYPEILAQQLHIDVKQLNEILDTCYEVKLFKNTDKGIYCAKILERCDRYTELLIKQSEHNNKKTVHKMSETSHKVVESTPRIEKNKKRIEEDKNKKENKNINIAKAIEAKPQYGNPDINLLKAYFLEVFKIPKEDCTQQQSGQYWNLLLKESKKGVDGVKWLVDLAYQDEFFRNNITSSKDLYYKRIKIIARKRGDVPMIAMMGGQNG